MAALAVAMCLVVGGSVALASVTRDPSSGPSESAVDPGRPDTEGEDPATGAPEPHDEGTSTPDAPPSSQPRTPPTTSRGDPPSSPDPAEVTASASTDAPPPSVSPSEPSPNGAKVVPDYKAPNTSLSEEFPESDAALFRLGADEATSFNCSLDGGAFKPCDSPTHYSDLKPGWHTFAVSAVDSAGNVDPTPAETRWLANNGNPGDDSES
ncbi:MAG TPA: hypothetical protein VFO49_16025 [Nocardioides sp.]|nr:hypothetical protein [Nocardioides sp.]